LFDLLVSDNNQIKTEPRFEIEKWNGNCEEKSHRYINLRLSVGCFTENPDRKMVQNN